jgi:hypothetical protein
MVIIFSFAGNLLTAAESVLDWRYRQQITPDYSLESTFQDYRLVELNYGYYSMSQTGYEPADTINDAKVAVINGQQFLFVNTGWGSLAGEGSPIEVFSVDHFFKPTTKLGETELTYSDFYTTTIPQLWNDTIILHGHTGGRGNCAFIGFYDISSNSFEMIDLDVDYGNYLTQVYYIEQLDVISLRFLSLDDMAITDMQVTCTPESLRNPLAWIKLAVTGGDILGLHENMFAYNPADGFGYLNRWSSNFESELIQYDLATGEGRQLFYAPPAVDAWCGLRNYLSANGSSIFFSSASVEGKPGGNNPGVWRYWEYNNGTLNNFANQSIVGFSNDFEGHGNIISLGGDFLLTSSLRDDRDDGSWFLYQGSTLLETYSGIGCHNTDNLLIKDGDNIVLGGEGKRLARVTLLTAGLNHTAKPDFSDIRFSVDGVTMMDHCLVHLNFGSTAYFVVDTSQVTDSFYIYFGNPEASSMSGSYAKFKNLDLYRGGIVSSSFGTLPSNQNQNPIPYSGTIQLSIEKPIIQESPKMTLAPKIDPTPVSVPTTAQQIPTPTTVQPGPNNMTFLLVIVLTFFVASFAVAVVLKIRRQK